MFRIRINWINGYGSGIQHFRLNTDPDPDPIRIQDFDDQKLEKNYRYSWKKILSCEYLREFSKKFETALMEYSGAWGKLIHEENQKSNLVSRDTVPLRPFVDTEPSA